MDDDAHFLPRLVLARDGTPLRQELGDPWSGGEPIPTGPVAAARDGSVLLGRGPNDREGAVLVRAQFGHTPLAYDPAFELNVFKAWPQPGLRCARMVVTDDGRIWAWLAVPGDPRARLLRFLPDGHPDPKFQPDTPIESLENSGEPFATDSRSTWLGASPGGHVVIVVDEPVLGGQRLRRLFSDGTTDPSFEVPFNRFNQHPKAMLPDGSVLIERRDPSDGPDQRYGLIRISPEGHRDPVWGAQVPNGWVINVFGGISVVPLANGSAWVEVHTGRSPTSELYRLHPDGSLDTSFDASVISPTPVRRLRLLASELIPGVTYSLRRSQGLPAGFTEWATFTVERFQTQPVSMWVLPPTEGEGEPPQGFWQLAEDPSP